MRPLLPLLFLLLLSCSRTTREERAAAAKLTEIFRDPTSIDDVLARIGELEARRPKHDWGFGYEVQRIRLAQPFFCALGLANVDGKLALWEASCDVGQDRLKEIEKELFERWPMFRRLEGSAFGFSGRRDDLLRARDDRLRAALGAMTKVSVPDELRKQYDWMINDSYADSVGEADCSVDVMYAHVIAKAGRWDLLRNALRGPNPAGRAGAAVALLERGELEDEDRRALRALKDIPVRACHGSFSQHDELLRNVLANASLNFHGNCADVPPPPAGRSLRLAADLEQPDLNWVALDEAMCASRRAGVRNSGGDETPVLTLSLKSLDGRSTAMTAVLRLRDKEQGTFACTADGDTESAAVRKAAACLVAAATK